MVEAIQKPGENRYRMKPAKACACLPINSPTLARWKPGWIESLRLASCQLQMRMNLPGLCVSPERYKTALQNPKAASDDLLPNVCKSYRLDTKLSFCIQDWNLDLAGWYIEVVPHMVPDLLCLSVRHVCPAPLRRTMQKLLHGTQA